MSFARPTLPTLIERAIADIESYLPGADARLRRSNLNVLARVSAGAAHGLYGYLAWIAKQILPDTADADILERHASIWLTVGRVPASTARGNARFSGADGAVIPAGTRIKRADGLIYLTTEDAIVAGGTAVAPIVAGEIGQIGNCDAGTPLRLESPLVGVTSTAKVTFAALTGGADMESDDALRERLLDRIKSPPMGGAAHDYIAWALEVPGVTRAWCYPEEMGLGTVTVRFTRDNDSNFIPDADEVATAQAYIEARKPVTAHLFVEAPIPVPIAFRLRVTPATIVVQAAVEAALRDLLIREAVPEGGNGEGTIYLSHIREAISLSADETDHDIEEPHANVTFTTGQMAIFGGITWV
jgi:uncharacterized phage protein gp47/JayE